MPRVLCEKCQRPQSVCLCPHFVHLNAPCRLLILQHPSEQKQALATVPILQQCIEPCEVWVGEDFSQHAGLPELLQEGAGIRVVFPANEAAKWRFGENHGVQANSVSTLIVLDGTWKKAKKIWYLNPWLHALPTVSLTDFPKTQYRIRQSTIEASLSTLEAVMHSFNWLTNSQLYDDLSNPFMAMIEMQIQKMGEETFLAHYGASEEDLME